MDYEICNQLCNLPITTNFPRTWSIILQCVLCRRDEEGHDEIIFVDVEGEFCQLYSLVRRDSPLEPMKVYIVRNGVVSKVTRCVTRFLSKEGYTIVQNKKYNSSITDVKNYPSDVFNPFQNLDQVITQCTKEQQLIRINVELIVVKVIWKSRKRTSVVGMDPKSLVACNLVCYKQEIQQGDHLQVLCGEYNSTGSRLYAENILKRDKSKSVCEFPKRYFPVGGMPFYNKEMEPVDDLYLKCNPSYIQNIHSLKDDTYYYLEEVPLFIVSIIESRQVYRIETREIGKEGKECGTFCAYKESIAASIYHYYSKKKRMEEDEDEELKEEIKGDSLVTFRLNKHSKYSKMNIFIVTIKPL